MTKREGLCFVVADGNKKLESQERKLQVWGSLALIYVSTHSCFDVKTTDNQPTANKWSSAKLTRYGPEPSLVAQSD